jgi:hypothetical protein
MRICWRLIFVDIIDEVALVGRYSELPRRSASICMFVFISIYAQPHSGSSLIYMSGTCALSFLSAFGENC